MKGKLQRFLQENVMDSNVVVNTDTRDYEKVYKELKNNTMDKYYLVMIIAECIAKCNNLELATKYFILFLNATESHSEYEHDAEIYSIELFGYAINIWLGENKI